MQTVILDSSVIIKWFKFKDELKIKEARSYLTAFKNKKIKLFVSHLTFFELLNIAAFEKNIPVQEWTNIIATLFDLSLTVVTLTSTLAQTMYKLSRKYHISAYDASYIAISQTQKIEFITADQKLVNTVHLPFVKSL